MRRATPAHVLLGLAGTLVAGCAGPSASPGGGGRARASPLLEFERPSDVVFVPGATHDTTRARGGGGSARLPGGATGIDLRGVLGRGAFPGPWGLLSIHVLSDEPGTATLACVTAAGATRRAADLTPGAWTPLEVDLAPLGLSPEADGPAEARLEIAGASAVWVDDLALVRNDRWIVRDGFDGWRLWERGKSYIGQTPGRFMIALPRADADPKGWRLVEAGRIRAVFVDADGDVRTVYADGRAYLAGRFTPVASLETLGRGVDRSHAEPGDVRVAPEQGHVARDRPGDRDQDGYDQTRGNWTIAATGRTLEVVLVPGGEPIVRTTLEVLGLPRGRVEATLEGELLQRVERRDDGAVLIDLPVRIVRPAAVQVRVR